MGAIELEFREVYEAKRRTKEIKKGGIDNSLPVTFNRKEFIKNRACTAKDIQTQDHKRNLVSLNKRLDDLDVKSAQSKSRIIAEQRR